MLQCALPTGQRRTVTLTNLGPRARARVVGPGPEAFGSTKVGPEDWKHGIPLFGGAESISGPGFPQFQGFRGVRR